MSKGIERVAGMSEEVLRQLEQAIERGRRDPWTRRESEAHYAALENAIVERRAVLETSGVHRG